MQVAPSSEWIELLRAEVASGRTKADVAREIGMPRPSLAMLLNGNYPAGLDRITRKYAARVLSRYRNQVLCPHLQAGIGLDLCTSHASAPMITGDPAKLRQWAACQRCPINPLKSGSSS